MQHAPPRETAARRASQRPPRQRSSTCRASDSADALGADSDKVWGRGGILALSARGLVSISYRPHRPLPFCRFSPLRAELHVAQPADEVHEVVVHVTKS